MKRKILVTLLAFCLIASLCVVGAAADGTALPEADKNGVITLNENVTLSSTWEVKSTVTLDLAGFTLNAASGHTITVKSGGDLTITDSSKDGTGVIDVTQHARGALVIEAGGEAKLAGGKLTRTVEASTSPTDNGGNSWYTVDNWGTFTVTGGTIHNTSKYSSLVRNLGTMYVTGGLIQQDNFNALKNDSDGEYSGKLYVTGGKVVSATQQAIQNWTEAEIGGSAEITGDVYTWASETYNSHGSTEITGGTIIGDVYAVTYDKSASAEVTITNGDITGTVAASRYGSATGTTIASVITIESSTINGDVINNGKNGTVISNSIITGDIEGTAEFTVSGSHVSGQVPDSAVVIDSTVAGVPTDSAPKGVVAVIGGKQFASLQDAIDSITTSDPTTIILVARAYMESINETIFNKDITIVGNGYPVTATVGTSSSETAIGISLSNTELTLDNVDMTVNGTVWAANGSNGGQAFDVQNNGSALNIVNDSHLTLQNLQTAFVLSGNVADRGEINIEDSDVTIANIDGNASNGGDWTVSGSTISYTNIGSHALSVETADVENSTITVNGAGLCAVYGKELNFGANTTVNVANSGPATPTENWNKTETYYGAVQIKELPGCSLTVESSAIINVSGTNNTVYLPAGAELVNNGTINATVNVPADSDMNVVLFVADGRQYDVQVVNDGDSVRMPTLSKSGYTFTGWRVNSSNTIVKGGESYPITANTTFTAVWNMIMIPDTYDIAVDQPAHGTVDVSFSNASQGSVITVTATPDEGYELVYITVDGEPISGNSFVMPDHAVEVSAVFAEIGKEVNFVDVSRADWFYDYVQYVAQNGLMEGTTRTAFEPNASMTRAMFWTVLARIDGETITGDAWKTLAQTWAVESGISDGTNADALITREQMVTMLYRYAGSPVTGGMAISEFTDGASVSDYATDAVTWALSEGILTGMGDGILAPQGTATRAQAAAMLMRFVEA